MRNTKELIGFSKKIATYLQTPTTFWKPDTARYMNLSPEQKGHGNQKLRQLLDTLKENKFLFRGTMGNLELDSAITTQELGHDFYKSGKSIDLDLIAHVRENHSALFLSTSECPYTAKPYASCIATWPCRGFILVLGRPKVTTVPHNLLRLHTAALTEYDNRMLSLSFDTENGSTKYHSIFKIIKNNNETTAILSDGCGKTNWKPTLENDVVQIIEVFGPGKMFGSFMAFSQPIYLGHVENSDFRPRQFSLEVVLHCDDYMQTAIKNAWKQGLIQPGYRFLTLADASAIDQSGQLDLRIESNEACQKTICVKQVPKNIPVGHQQMLVDHLEQLQPMSKTTSMQPLNK